MDSCMDPKWESSTEPCPVDGAPTEIGNWWDDHPEEGGAIIGTLHRCTSCDWTDRR